jgi:hypothetical protein
MNYCPEHGGQDGYTTPLCPGDLPDDVLCTVFADKRQVGGVPDSGVTMPLAVALTEKFEQDHHLAPYVTPQSMRLRKEMHEATTFGCCLFDLDYDTLRQALAERGYKEASNLQRVDAPGPATRFGTPTDHHVWLSHTLQRPTA